MDASDLEVVGPGRWVDDASVDLGEGARAALHRGLVFPVRDGDGVDAGFVFVGGIHAALPTGAGALALRAAGAPVPDGGFAPDGDLLVALGRDPDLAAAASAGVPILPHEDDVVFLDDAGREVVLITDLRPRAALDDARDALRQRTWLLAGAGLDPRAMLAREAWRDGPPRSVAELRTPLDLRPLTTGPRRPWLTWVVDPTGLVDDALAGVLGVHGGPDDARVWRALGGTPRSGPPALAAERATINVTVIRDGGVTLRGQVTARLTARAGEEGALVDLWVPETLDLPRGGALAVDSDPEPVVTVHDQAATPVDAPFGPRRVPGAVRHTVRLPEPVPAGSAVSLTVAWDEAWDVGGVLLPREFVGWAWDGPANRRPNPGALPEVESLGKVAAGLTVAPIPATGPQRFPVELRAGTNVPGWTVAAGAGGTGLVQENGTMWTVSTRAPAPLAVGRFKEFRSPGRAGLPPIRVLRHGLLAEDLLVTIRGILHFYDSALPPWPYPEVVVVQAPLTPVLMVESGARPEADPYVVTPGFRHEGGGVLTFHGLFAVGTPIDVLAGDEVRTTLPPAGEEVRRAVDRTLPNAPTRSLAEALAAAWWDGVPAPAEDAWLRAAIPCLYRDRFVEEAWGHDALHAWDRATEQLLARTEPPGDQRPFPADAWGAERGARLLRLALARVGERDLLEVLEAQRARGDASVAGLATALERETDVSFAGLFAVFATAGLRPAVTASIDAAGTLTVATDPPVGSWDVPVAVDGRLRWVPVVDGAGSVVVPGGGHREVEVDPEGWLPLRRAERVAVEGEGRRRRRERAGAE